MVPDNAKSSSAQSPKSANTGRRISFSTLDAFRGFAALWVVSMHSSIEIVSLKFPHLMRNPLVVFTVFGSLGVRIFFVVSGFCIANASTIAIGRATKTRSFLRARARRIYPPYLFALLATVAMSVVAAWLVSHAILPKSHIGQMDFFGRTPLWYISQFTLTQIPLRQPPLVIIYWTLCYEVAFYVIVAAAMWLVRLTAAPERWLLPTLHVLSVASMAVLAVSPRWQIFPFDLWPQFGLGVLAFDLIARRHPSAISQGPHPWPFAVGLILAMAVSLARFNYGGDAYHPGNRATFTTAAVFAAVLVLLHPFDARLARFGPVKLLAWIGTFSYSLYLTHMMPLGLVMQPGRRWATTPARFGLVFVAEILVGVICAYPFFVLFERPFLSSRAKARVAVETTALGAAVDPITELTV